MKIINATWEKRNLGVSTQEIQAEPHDSISNFKDSLCSLSAQYQVLKIPANKIDFVHYAEDMGFRFVESQLTMTANLKKIVPNTEKILSRAKDFSTSTDNSPETFDFVASQINKGIFHTDRISIDPLFSVQIANKRYANWLLDLKYHPNAHLQIMKQKNAIIAFNLNQNEGRISHGLIGGILKEHQKEPIGLYWGASILKNLHTLDNIDLWEAVVSSNNGSIIKLWEFLGLQLSSICYIFVKHSN